MILGENMIFIGFNRSTKLKWVQISFATPTFDRITKDEKANLATKLSAVGGTLGLLTGFSFIGGVVFVEKILMGLVGKLQEMRNKKKIASEETNQTVIMVESAESEEEPNLELNNMDQEETETETFVIDVEFENDSYLSGYLT